VKQAFKKYFSFFLLGVFLFSYSEKGIHALIHADDPHCHALNAKHFHTIEHNCPICDFELPFFDTSLSFTQPHFIRSYAAANHFSAERRIIASGNSFSSSRAPPITA
jgi:hypothetical protein